jgi:hypothetical protein
MSIKKHHLMTVGTLLLALSVAYGQSAPRAGGPLRILFAGDLGWGESYQDEYEKAGQGNVLKEHGYDWGLEKLSPLWKTADVIIANLETPVAATRTSPFVGQKDYIHYADHVQTPAALVRHGIRVVSLANNHTKDLGDAGLAGTFDVLSSNGIEYLGAGKDERGARRPWHRVFTVGKQTFSLYVIAAFEYRSGEYDTKYEFYARPDRAGVAAVDVDVLKTQVAEIRAADPAAFIVYFVHWGDNYVWRSDAQTTTGHACIDAGVDLVIGHGAHMMQEFERYRDKWIVYSIGNFLFNARGRYAANKVDPFGLPAVLTVQPMGKTLSLSLELTPIISDNTITGYQPRPATPEEFARAHEVLVTRSPGAASWGPLVTTRTDGPRQFLLLSVR